MKNEQKIKKIADKVFDEPHTNVSFYNMAIEIGTKVAQWKDEQYNEEKKDLISLVNMLLVDEQHEYIIKGVKIVAPNKKIAIKIYNLLNPKK